MLEQTRLSAGSIQSPQFGTKTGQSGPISSPIHAGAPRYDNWSRDIRRYQENIARKKGEHFAKKIDASLMLSSRSTKLIFFDPLNGRPQAGHIQLLSPDMAQDITRTERILKDCLARAAARAARAPWAFFSSLLGLCLPQSRLREAYWHHPDPDRKCDQRCDPLITQTKLGFSWPNSKPRLCEWILASSSHAVAIAETLNKNKTKTRKAPPPAHLVSKNVIKPQKAIPCSFFAWQVLAFVLKIIDCSNRSKSIYLCSLVKSATPCQRGPLLFQNLSSGRKPAVPAGELAKPGCMILIATVSFSNACDQIRWHKLANDC